MNFKHDSQTNSQRRRSAAEWIVKLQDPDISAEALIECGVWIERNPLNQQAFDDVERLSRMTDGFRSDLVDIPMPSIADRGNDNYVGSESVSDWIKQQSGEPGGQDSVTGLVAARTPRILAIAAGLAIVAIIAGLLFRVDFVGPAAVERLQSYATAESEHRVVVLSDGSEITIGAKSSLSVNYSGKRRAVVLEEGEALFTVAKDTARPFVVIAGNGIITATGTAFNVRRDEGQVVVTVTEGEVKIEQRASEGNAINPLDRTPEKGPQLVSGNLKAGHQGTYSAAGIRIVEMANPAIATAWREGHLQYRAEPLKYVVTGVNRYSDVEIIIADTIVEETVFTGSVLQNQTHDWLRGLEKVFPIEVVDIGDNKVLLKARAAN